MKDTLTVNLTPEVKTVLEDYVKGEGISPDDLVCQAIADYLFIRKFRTLRSSLRQKSSVNYTDEDIFEMIS